MDTLEYQHIKDGLISLLNELYPLGQERWIFHMFQARKIWSFSPQYVKSLAMQD